MKWVIQEDVFEENYLDDMEEALGNLGMARGSGYDIIKYIPFADATYLPIAPQNKVVVYGSINLLRQVDRFTNWEPGSGVTWENYKCSNYYPHFRGHMLNNTGAWYPLHELLKRKNWAALGHYDSAGPKFVRPDDGIKSFVGGLYDFNSLEIASHLCDNILVYVDQPINNIDAEWRFYIVNKEVITWSQYQYRGRKVVARGHPDKAIEYAQQLAQIYQPDNCFTIDIAEIKDQYKVVGINSMHCAGLYACDIPKLVTTMHFFYLKKKEGLW